MKVLQLTDSHLYGNASGRLRGVETHSSLAAALDDANLRVPDFEALLVTGDLVQDDATGYLRFKSFFAHLGKPVLCIPGNHDDPQAMGAALDAEPFRICGAHEFGAWNFVMLNSYDPGCVGGRLTDAELARLDDSLGRSAKHAMICLHHHPVEMGSQWLDSIGLANADEFWRVLDTHANVRAVTFGHVHQQFESRRGDVQLFATPSTGAQFLPRSDHFEVDGRPPAYRPFELHDDGRIETHVVWVDFLPMQRTAAR